MRLLEFRQVTQEFHAMRCPPSRPLLKLMVLAAVFPAGPAAGELEKAPPKTSASGPVSPTRRIQRLSYDFKAAGKKMEYGLFVPSSYQDEANKEKKYPLVVALHGLGSNPQQILRYRGLVRLAEKYGYIVVAPMGYNSRGWYGVRGQRSRFSRPSNLGELSEKDVMNVLKLTEKAYRVNPKRIYLMGHSMGGGGTLYLGMKYPKQWAGLAPIAPAIFSSTRGLEKIRDMPVIVVQGARDTLVRASRTRRWVRKMKDLEMTHKYIEYRNGDHISPAYDGLPAIFEFFNTHTERGKPRVPAPPGDG
jgi:poly(3-hydroxybutyrate) depolymerase